MRGITKDEQSRFLHRRGKQKAEVSQANRRSLRPATARTHSSPMHTGFRTRGALADWTHGERNPRESRRHVRPGPCSCCSTVILRVAGRISETGASAPASATCACAQSATAPNGRCRRSQCGMVARTRSYKARSPRSGRKPAREHNPRRPPAEAARSYSRRKTSRPRLFTIERRSVLIHPTFARLRAPASPPMPTAFSSKLQQTLRCAGELSARRGLAGLARRFAKETKAREKQAPRPAACAKRKKNAAAWRQPRRRRGRRFPRPSRPRTRRPGPESSPTGMDREHHPWSWSGPDRIEKSAGLRSRPQGGLPGEGSRYLQKA